MTPTMNALASALTGAGSRAAWERAASPARAPPARR
jgi:hypothetical protein